MKLQECFNTIRACEQMYEAGKAATAYFYELCSNDPTLISGSLFRVNDIKNCSEDIEDTYLIKLFALFEVVLRDFEIKFLKRKSKSGIRQLIDKIASHQYVQDDVRKRVHIVRNYRNSVVHAGVSTPITLKDARSFLCQFLANLPRNW